MPENYRSVDVPSDKAPTDYSYVERRADILDRILAKGSPSAVHQARLADVYGVSPAQISKDMGRISDDIATHLDDKLELRTLALYEQTIDQLHSEGRYKQAWDVHLDWLEYLGHHPRPAPTDDPSGSSTGDVIRTLPPETRRLMDQLTGTGADTQETTRIQG